LWSTLPRAVGGLNKFAQYRKPSIVCDSIVLPTKSIEVITKVLLAFNAGIQFFIREVAKALRT
jgi:hypothetical protein